MHSDVSRFQVYVTGSGGCHRVRLSALVLPSVTVEGLGRAACELNTRGEDLLLGLHRSGLCSVAFADKNCETRVSYYAGAEECYYNLTRMALEVTTADSAALVNYIETAGWEVTGEIG